MESDVHRIKPLYQIALFLGLIPPSKISQCCKFLFYKYYCCCIGIILTSISCISIVAENDGLYAEFSLTLKVIDAVTSLLATFSVYVAISISILKNKKIQDFINTFFEFDNFQGLVNKPINHPYIQLISVHILITIFITGNMYFCIISGGVGMLIKISNRTISHYFHIILTMLVCNFAVLIKAKLKWFNTELKNALENSHKAEIHHNLEDQMTILHEIQKSRKLFCRIGNLIEVFNEIFGWQILWITINVSVGFLETVNSVINFSIHGVSNNLLFDLEVICLTSLWSVSCVVSYAFVLFI